MKRLLLTSLLALAPFSANAEAYWAEKPVQCGTEKEVVALAVKYGETPLIVMNGLTMSPNGVGYNAQYILAMNQETETWTLIEKVNENQVCILASGRGYTSALDLGTKVLYK